NSSQFSVNQSKIFVGGASSGANLAAGLLFKIRDGGMVMPRGHILINPLLDMTFNGSYLLQLTSNCTYGSSRQDYVDLLNSYTNNSPNYNDYYLNPLGTANYTGLTDGLIISSNDDPLRDDAIIWGKRLKAAGYRIVLINFYDVPHVFHLFDSLGTSNFPELFPKQSISLYGAIGAFIDSY